MTDAAAEPITRDDIEAKLQSLKGDVDQRADDAKSKIIVGGAIGAVVLLLLMYMLGKRVGTKKSTVVEIRRV
jgi:hypothetical protein